MTADETIKPITDSFQIEVELNKRLAPAGRSPRSRESWSGVAGDCYLAQVPAIKCADGLSMSVQTGSALYCIPRDSLGPWSSVEVGYPSRRVEELMPYVDGDGSSHETVYGYVPLHIVVGVIAKAGGLL